MHPSQNTRRRLLPEERRLELLDAGDRVVRKLGMRARVEDVVRAAGAAKGTFYVYFDTWDAFLLALRERTMVHLAGQFQDYLDGCTDWVELIGGMPALFVDMTLSLEGLHAALFHGAVASVAVAPRLDVLSRIGELISEGIDQKALQADHVPTTSRLAFALLHEGADLVESGQRRDRVESSLRALLLNALKVKAVSLRPGALNR